MQTVVIAETPDWMKYLEIPPTDHTVEKIDTILAKRMKEFMRTRKEKSSIQTIDTHLYLCLYN